jgi:HSP20 family protein
MPNVRNILPGRKRESGAGQAMRPISRGMEEFLEHSFPPRWMEGFFEPYAWKGPHWGELGQSADLWPRIDILDKDDALVVRAEMPGIDKEDLVITIAGDRLTLEAKRNFADEEKKEDFFRSEMAYGRLFRVVHLPVEVLGDKARAEMKDGIIEVYLPKVEGITPHTIKVA